MASTCSCGVVRPTGILERIGATSLARCKNTSAFPCCARAPMAKTRKLPGSRRAICRSHCTSPVSCPVRLPVGGRSSPHGARRSALQRMDLEDPSLDDISFGSSSNATAEAPRRLRILDLITLPTLNVHAHDASLALAGNGLQDGVVEGSSFSRHWVGARPARRAPRHPRRARAGEVRRDASHESQGRGDHPHQRRSVQPSVSGVVVDGAHLAADAVVLAVAHEQAADLLLGAAAIDSASLRGLGRSPIIDVHVVYDKKVMHFDIAAGIDSPVQYVFDRTEASGMTPGRASVSRYRYPMRTKNTVSVLKCSSTDIRRLLARCSVGTHREGHRCCRQPGTRCNISRRPGYGKVTSRTTNGLYQPVPRRRLLDTGWPATMEGAVRSGNTAAACVSASQGRRAESTFVAQEVVA